MIEPSIVVNGTHLTAAQAMTVRVAIQQFATTLNVRDSMDAAYMQTIREINVLLLGKRRSTR